MSTYNGIVTANFVRVDEQIVVKNSFLNIKEKCFILDIDFFGKAKLVV